MRERGPRSLHKVIPMSKYFAYYVDFAGAARARYELKAIDDCRAVAEGRQFMKLHPSVEIWQGSRIVARLLRKTAPCAESLNRPLYLLCRRA